MQRLENDSAHAAHTHSSHSTRLIQQRLWLPLHLGGSGRQGGRAGRLAGWQAGKLGTAPIGGLRLLAFHVARDPRQTTGAEQRQKGGGVGGVTRGWHACPQLLTKSLDLCDCVPPLPPGPVPSVIHSRPAGFCRSCAWRGIHSTFVQARGARRLQETGNCAIHQTPDSRLQRLLEKLSRTYGVL